MCLCGCVAILVEYGPDGALWACPNHGLVTTDSLLGVSEYEESNEG